LNAFGRPRVRFSVLSMSDSALNFHAAVMPATASAG